MSSPKTNEIQPLLQGKPQSFKSFTSARRGDRAATVLAFLQEVLSNNSVTVADLEVRARVAGLLGKRQTITDAKVFRSPKSSPASARVAMVSDRRGFGSGLCRSRPPRW